MSARRAALILMLMCLALAVAATLFVTLVPIDFTFAARGRIVPSRVTRVAFSRDGRLNFVSPATNFKKGDVIASLDAAAEEAELKFLKDELVIYEEGERLAREALTRFDAEKRYRVRRAALELEKLSGELALEKTHLDIYQDLSESARERKQLDEDLSEEALKIYASLYEKHLVPKMDYLKLVFDRQKSVIMLKELSIQEKETLFKSRAAIQRVEAEMKLIGSDKQYWESQVDVSTRLIEAREKIVSARKRVADLEQICRAKRFPAPYDGQILERSAVPLETVKNAQTVLTIGDLSRPRFEAMIDQAHRDELRLGARAMIFLDNFPFQDHGFVEGKVEAIRTAFLSEPDLSAPGRYALWISLEKPFRDFEPGLSGNADIVIFRGTIFQYLTRR